MKKILLLTLLSAILLVLVVLTPGYLSYFSLCYRHHIPPEIVKGSVVAMNKVYEEIGGNISSEDIEDFQLSELKEFMDETTKRMKIEGLSANMRTLTYYFELCDDPEGKNLKNLIRNHIAEDYFMFSNAENRKEIDLIGSIESLAEDDPILKDLITKSDANKAVERNAEIAPLPQHPSH